MGISTRDQVVAQCRAIAHMAEAIAKVHRDMAALCSSQPAMEPVLEQTGRDTARYMETLGNILNDMDAVTAEDQWTQPIFEEAQRRWPSAGAAP